MDFSQNTPAPPSEITEPKAGLFRRRHAPGKTPASHNRRMPWEFLIIYLTAKEVSIN
jgi:hypothetical protein